MNKSYIPSRKKKKSRLWMWIVVIVCFFGAAIAGAMFASSSLLDKVEDVPEDDLLTAKDKATIMIMGVDEREDDVGRSDTLMIATIDPAKDKAALLSIPRDTRVKIKGHGYDKINAAYAYGKENLTHRTVEDFLGVNIDHYVIINVKAFVNIIDAIGGVDIDVEKRMYYEDPWDDDGGLLIDLRPGSQHMDGKTAVTYVRYRDEEGDIGRIKRQQKFMKACMDKVTSPSIITKLPSVVSEVMNSVKTDLSMRQLLEFAGTLKNAQQNGLDAEMVPGRPLYIEGISYWIPDISKLRSIIADTLGISISDSMRSTFERTAREYENSIPASATEVPAGDTSIGHAVSSSKKTDKKSTAKDSKDSKENKESSKKDIPEKDVPEKDSKKSTASGNTQKTSGETPPPAPQGRDSGQGSASTVETPQPITVQQSDAPPLKGGYEKR